MPHPAAPPISFSIQAAINNALARGRHETKIRPPAADPDPRYSHMRLVGSIRTTGLAVARAKPSLIHQILSPPSRSMRHHLSALLSAWG